MIFARIEQDGVMYTGEGLNPTLALDDLIEKLNQTSEIIQYPGGITFWEAEKMNHLVCRIQYQVESR